MELNGVDWNGMKRNKMEWNCVHGMEKNENFRSKLMLDAPKEHSRSLQDQSQRLPGTLKFAFGSTSGRKLGCHCPSGQSLGHPGGPSWRPEAAMIPSKMLVFLLNGSRMNRSSKTHVI